MITICQNCKAEYDLDEQKVPTAGGFFKCRSCGERISLSTHESIPVPLPPSLETTAPFSNMEESPDESTSTSESAFEVEMPSQLETPLPTPFDAPLPTPIATPAPAPIEPEQPTSQELFPIPPAGDLFSTSLLESPPNSAVIDPITPPFVASPESLLDAETEADSSNESQLDDAFPITDESKDYNNDSNPEFDDFTAPDIKVELPSPPSESSEFSTVEISPEQATPEENSSPYTAAAEFVASDFTNDVSPTMTTEQQGSVASPQSPYQMEHNEYEFMNDLPTPAIDSTNYESQNQDNQPPPITSTQQSNIAEPITSRTYSAEDFEDLPAPIPTESESVTRLDDLYLSTVDKQNTFNSYSQDLPTPLIEAKSASENIDEIQEIDSDDLLEIDEVTEVTAEEAITTATTSTTPNIDSAPDQIVQDQIAPANNQDLEHAEVNFDIYASEDSTTEQSQALNFNEVNGFGGFEDIKADLSIESLRSSPTAPALMDQITDEVKPVSNKSGQKNVSSDNRAVFENDDISLPPAASSNSNLARIILFSLLGLVLLSSIGSSIFVIMYYGSIDAGINRVIEFFKYSDSKPVATSDTLEKPIAKSEDSAVKATKDTAPDDVEPTTIVTASSPPTPSETKPPSQTVSTSHPSPILTSENVNTLSYRNLALATKILAEELVKKNDRTREGLLWWAWYRLANFGDSAALNALQKRAPKPNDAAVRGELAVGAVGGLLLLSGKIKPARKLVEKLLRRQYRNSVVLGLVAARTYLKPREANKAQKYLSAIIKKSPGFIDASLMFAKIKLQKPKTAQAAIEMLSAIALNADPAISLEVAITLIYAGYYEAADKIAITWNIKDVANIPASKRNLFLRLLSHRFIREVDFTNARSVIHEQLKDNPNDATAIIELQWSNIDANYDLAQKELLKASKQLSNPEDIARVAVARARIFLLNNNINKAAAALAESANNPAATAWIKYGQGLVAIQQKQKKQAIAAFKMATKGRPGFIEPQVELAKLTLSGKRLDAKLKVLNKAGNTGAASYALAQLQIQKGSAATAAKLFDKALWLEPTVTSYSKLISLWIESLESAGQKTRAQDVLQKIIQKQSKDESALLLILNIAKRANNVEQIVEIRKALLDLAPDDIDRTIDLARAFMSAKNTQKAESILTILQQKEGNQKNPAIILELGRLRIDSDPVKARILMQESIDLKPSFAAYVALADLEAKLGRADEAYEAYHKALALNPDSIEIHYSLIRMMMQKRAFKDAIVELKRLLKADPKNVKAHEMLADTMLELNDAKAAVSEYTNAINAGGDNPDVLMKLARTQLQQLGMIAPAVKTLRRIIQLDAKYAIAYYYLGLALKDLGKVREARVALKSYLSLAEHGEFAKDAQRLLDDLERM
ncbi:MAG: zinc-ribbon domain-containing protein [Deltaproteobacteria bacterium]|nr:zinc-ribbon domain-containing protein [Deltaproteobacteria bacterium]